MAISEYVPMCDDFLKFDQCFLVFLVEDGMGLFENKSKRI